MHANDENWNWRTERTICCVQFSYCRIKDRPPTCFISVHYARREHFLFFLLRFARTTHPIQSMQSRPRVKNANQSSPLFVSFDESHATGSARARHLLEFHGNYWSNDSSTGRWQATDSNLCVSVSSNVQWSMYSLLCFRCANNLWTICA